MSYGRELAQEREISEEIGRRDVEEMAKRGLWTMKDGTKFTFQK